MGISIEVKNIKKSFSSLVLDDITFSIEEKKIVTIMGENGCGKTTLFYIVAGIWKPDQGSVFIKGSEPSKVFPSIVYQKYCESLFPWWTVRQNIEFASKCTQNTPNTLFDPNKLIRTFGINNFEVRYPYELSGGENQLVAIARALAFGGEVLLFDEPSSSLNFQMEECFHQVFLEYCQQRNATVLFISHDPREAVYISDKVIVLSKNPAKVNNCLDINLSHPRDKACTNYNKIVKELITLCKEATK